MRGIVIARKGAPAATDDGDDTGGPDVETCPNCQCKFTDEGDKPVIVSPGKPVQGGANQGKEMDTLDAAEPVPGKFGTARDGAVGTTAMAHLLGALGGGH